MAHRAILIVIAAAALAAGAPAVAQVVPHAPVMPPVPLGPPMGPPVGSAVAGTVGNISSAVSGTVANSAARAATAAGSVGSIVSGTVSRADTALDGTANVAGDALKDTTHALGKTVKDTADETRDSVGRPADSRLFEQDVNGARVIRGEVLCLSPTDRSLAIARGLSFDVAQQETLASLNLSIAVLRAPQGMTVTDALVALRRADPSGTYDYDHIYDPTGNDSTAAAQGGGPAVSGASRIGMIDGGVDRTHPAFHGTGIESRVFAGSATPTAHGTAVASLLVGNDGNFQGALRGTRLFAADVYGGSPTGGSADDIAEALGWLASSDVPVANISLAGPPNLILQAATASFVKTGHVLVAAVGNDGPAAPLRYPAAYPGVVGVTSVDGAHAVEIDANRGSSVSFAALGVGVRAATLQHGYAPMTGTSFAAPVVAARFALLVDRPDPVVAARAWTTLEHEALPLGPPGRDPVFGYGFLGRPSTAVASR